MAAPAHHIHKSALKDFTMMMNNTLAQRKR